jgi:hypothetical protein
LLTTIQSGSPEGFIALTAECTVEQAPDARKFGFALTTGLHSDALEVSTESTEGVGNPDYFAAETAEDMKSWINAINSAIEVLLLQNDLFVTNVEYK